MKIAPIPVVVTLAGIVCIGLAIAYNGHKLEQRANAPKPEPIIAIAPNVSVINAVPNTYQAYVSGHGAAKAHWALNLTAQVQGEVLSMSEQFATGQLIKKGHVIAQIDNTEYLQAVASAKATLAEAQYTLQEEQDLADQAKREWQRSGITQQPSSPLVFRTLQLEAAQASADNAKYALQTAQRDEKNSHISAPFDAVILTRDIDLGAYVSVGDAIATLNSTDKVEISVPLSLNQWQNLVDKSTSDVLLRDVTTGTQWRGYIDRFEQHLDDSSRQRSVVVAVDQPFSQPTPLLPGTYLAVEIPGKTLEQVIKLPASAVSQDGLIWYVNEKNRLASSVVNKVFERGDYIYISPLAGQNSLQVVARPLVSYLNEMQVNPVVEEMP
ncbi:efflux RND transporter periplasmic adaptor subunit [Pseudoalteromonas sp. MMG010]|uniref:efflux RND transporter periplasmic adaptor subunit n=1 Tax=Pseudoalteromonas sp. MMG010 TaxID=2822685 RepID=UPI001B39E5F6|nr:efflux RND transporter periplasmic adaptor subunit [Pseudoalteromonas sp. MMG010]MBQ4832029.1 efflux RND transporter periplasmic adaptor subunit [Pseudoalteromonas sp. MMG010]